MERLSVYKNKGETFKCNFQVEGTSADEVQVRLCLEFDDNKNLFFNGRLNKDGECTFQIPKLPEVDSRTGKLTVEAIAENSYFKVYECDIELKNSVEVKMTREHTSAAPEPQKKIDLSEIKRVVERPVVEEVEEEAPKAQNPFIPRTVKPGIKK